MFSEVSLSLSDRRLLALIQLSGILRHSFEILLIVVIQLVILLLPVFTLVQTTAIVHLQQYVHLTVHGLGKPCLVLSIRLVSLSAT